MTSCWKSQSWFRSLGGKIAVCFLSSLQHGVVTRLLFFLLGYLFSNVSIVDLCRSYPKRSKQDKIIYICIVRRVRLLFWQEDRKWLTWKITMWACPGMVLPVTDQASPVWGRFLLGAQQDSGGIPLTTASGLKIWQRVWGVWFHRINK